VRSSYRRKGICSSSFEGNCIGWLCAGRFCQTRFCFCRNRLPHLVSVIRIFMRSLLRIDLCCLLGLFSIWCSIFCGESFVRDWDCSLLISCLFQDVSWSITILEKCSLL
jgi:hypothetical protein